ncbi:hypothetical protein CGI84_21140 [Vibrio parahaemolyticus]|nr:hypothetical protein CGJ41_23865 [Vibrio parahaemolyticus]TOF33597.1 hypothetical protein CGJ28_22295 [Vibrio parahaemolyticus]TOH27904.1 hypothetical protein CGI84_21140 [Vibrio parahaemolyticus]TOP89320.1 hypothetical protein CGH06_22830 [Vibrio parahaemolyticus]
MCFDAIKSGIVSKRLLNETTWNKQRRRKRTHNTKENAISANKSAVVPTNSTSRVSAKKFDSVNPKVTVPKNKSTVETMPILDFYHVN